MSHTEQPPTIPPFLQSAHPLAPADRSLASEQWIRKVQTYLHELERFIFHLRDYTNTLGDMAKSTYDTDDDGVVDNAEALGGTAASGFPTLAGSNTFTSTNSFSGTLSSSGTANLGGVTNFPFVTLTQVTADQTDWAPSSSTGIFFRASTDASRTIHGIVAPSGSAVRWYWNVGSFDIVFANNSGSASAANRMLLTTGADFTCTPNRGILLIYDSVTAKWRGHPL